MLKYFWEVVRRFKLSFFSVIIMTIGSSVLDVFIPFQYLRLWNVLTSNNFTAVPEARSLVLLILILNLFRWVMRRISGFSLSYFEANSMAGLRAQAFSYMIGHSHGFFANNFGGTLTHRINKYARAFEKITDRMLTDGLPLLVRGIGTVFAIYTLFPKYAYIFGIFCLTFVLTAAIYIRFKLKYDVIASEADSRTTGAFADSIGNHSSIQLFTGHKHEKERVGEIVRDQKNKMVFNFYLWEGLGALQSFYSLIVEFVIFWFVIGDWKLGLITLPVIVLMQNYLIRLFDNLYSFGAIVRAYYESFADAEEMAVVLNTPYEVIDNPTETLPEGTKGEVTFENVTYIYENNNAKVLNNFSLTIPAGQKIALVGSSGAGKTTVVRLLMRLFNISSGKIEIDGVDINTISQKNLRDKIAFVPQDPSLFHRTLMENIRYGRRESKNEEVLRAAHLAHCDEFIDSLPKGYNTYVGERGVKLSGGERQRVAIARAILKDAPILILDEATSSLDSHSESLIRDALHALIKGKTTIVIAHRLSTIREMDRIIVLDKGKIIEDGVHDDLIKKKSGLYKKLWDLQAGGFKNVI